MTRKNGDSKTRKRGKPGKTSDVVGRCTAMNRLREVRIEEGLPRRTVARRLGISMAELDLQEQKTTDLPLSILYKWQKALNVPLLDLLVEPDDSLSPPLLKRGQLLRLMKTALAIVKESREGRARRLGQRMVEQLLEIAPELSGVSPWPSIGRRRGDKDLGRTAERSFPDSLFFE